jgi:hypothetical protein
MRRYPFAVQCDIRKFFPSIDDELLKETFRRRLKDSSFASGPTLGVRGFTPLRYNRAPSPHSVPPMTTLAKRTANQRNAQLSTGPKSDAGKAVARLNAVAHGLRAHSPVVPGEDPATWEAYRDAVVSDLRPVGVLETELADRVALLSWRLRRVIAFEVGTVARASDKAARKARGDDPLDERLGITAPPPATPKNVQFIIDRVAWAENARRSAEQLSHVLTVFREATSETIISGADAVFLLQRLPSYLPEPDDDELDDFDQDDDAAAQLDPMTDVHHPRFLLALDVPTDLHGEPESWCGWTVGGVRKGVERIAKSAGWTAKQLLDNAGRGATEEVEQRRAEAAELSGGLEVVRRLTEEAEDAARRRAQVPVEVVDAVVKYEGHLQRQLTQTLHELDRRQALRSDSPPQPPVAVDVIIHAPDGAGEMLGLGAAG